MAVLAVGAWLRFQGLGRESLWYDEGVSWRMSQLSLSEIVRRTAQDVHPPLYYFLLKGWAFAFGDSVFALRSLSALCGVATVAAVFFFTRSLCSAPSAGRAGDDAPRWAGGTGAALLAAALTALSVFQITHGRETRMYPLGGLLAVLSSWALSCALFRPAASVRAWIVYLALASALVYTHNYGVFTVVAQALFAFGYLLSRRAGEDPTARISTEFRHAALAFLGVVVAYLPWLPVALGQNSQVVAEYWIPALSLNSVAAAVETVFTGDRAFRLHPDAGPAAVLALAALLVVLFWQKHRVATYLLLLAFVPFALALAMSVMQGRNVLSGRYLYFTSPFLLVGMALVVCSARARVPRIALASLAIAGFASQDWLYWSLTSGRYSPGLQDAAQVIRERYQDGDLVVTPMPGDFFAMNYYLRPRAHVLLWLHDADRLAAFDGRPFLKDGDLVVGPRPLAGAGSRIWFLQSKGRDDLPSLVEGRYRLLGGWTFGESIPYRSHYVTLFLYEREDRPREDARTRTRAGADARASG
jgi:hypothetical protein